MKEHDGDIRGFHHLSKAWYGDVCLKPGGPDDQKVDEVVFGFYSPEGGTSGEMVVTWEQLGGRTVPQLKVYDDAWHALNQLQDVLQELAEAEGENISPDQFCEILLRCGFKDLTMKERK